MIPRKQIISEASDCIYFAWKNNLVCIYNDREKNLQSNDARDVSSENNTGDLVLAEAVISSDGAVLSKKKIADKPQGGNSFFTGVPQRLSSTSYVIPLGRRRVNMMQYYTELTQWATLSIQ